MTIYVLFGYETMFKRSRTQLEAEIIDEEEAQSEETRRLNLQTITERGEENLQPDALHSG